MSWLIRLGLRRGWRHGVLGGDQRWLIVGAVALLLRLAGRAISREESVVYREVLQPGERLIITHEPKL